MIADQKELLFPQCDQEELSVSWVLQCWPMKTKRSVLPWYYWLFVVSVGKYPRKYLKWINVPCYKTHIILKYRPNDIILISSECANSKTHCLFVNWFFSFLWGLHEKFRKKNFSLMTGGHKTEILELVTDRWLNFIDLRFICSLPSHQWQHILLPIQGLFQKVPVYNVLVLLALTCLQVFSKSPFNDRRHNPLSMVTLPSNLHKNFEAIFGWQNMLSFWAGLKQKYARNLSSLHVITIN